MPTRKLIDGLYYRKILAWSVHAFTATGSVWGFMSILAILQHDWKMCFVWIAIAMVVDGLDGTLARLFHTQVYAKGVDGALMDNIIDYLNFVIVPVFFIMEANLLPAVVTLPTIAAILMASAYQFSQVDAKTEDHFFKGFPSYWNILVLYLFLLSTNAWVNFALIALCLVLVFIPIKFIYPSRAPKNRKLHMGMLYVWGISGFIAIMQYPNVPLWVIWASLIVVAIYLASSLAATLRRPSGDPHSPIE
jgi:phosphatidylcholine synthase